MQRFLRTLFVTVLSVVAVSTCGFSPQKLVHRMTTTEPLSASPPASAKEKFSTTVDSSKLIYVTPMQGVSPSAGLVLADAIAATLRDAGKPAILSPLKNEMGPSVSGRIIAQEERGSVIWVTALWELLAPYGTVVAEYRQQVVVDKRLWREGSAEAINLLVSDAGPQVAKLVHEYVSPIAMTKNLPIADPLPGGFSPPPFVSAALPDLAPTGGTQAPPGKPLVKAGREVNATLAHRKKPLPKKQTAQKTVAPPPVLRPVPEASPPRPTSPYRAARLALETPQLLDRQAAKKKNILKPVPETGKPRVNTDPAPVSWNRPSFLIKVVQGAPGDGNAALTKAMKVALRKRDITVTEDPRQAGYVIKGNVEVSAPVGGRQQAKIVWAVNTMGGDEVGKAVQENAVKAGSLNGTWGRVADIVSNAAVSGIRELFGVEEKKSSRRSASPKFSGGPPLPQVPGRAAPPP